MAKCKCADDPCKCDCCGAKCETCHPTQKTWYLTYPYPYAPPTTWPWWNQPYGTVTTSGSAGTTTSPVPININAIY